MLVGINGCNIKVVAVIPCKSGTSYFNSCLKFSAKIRIFNSGKNISSAKTLSL